MTPKAPRVLIVLGVDGTVSRVFRDDEYDDPGGTRVLQLDESVIDGLSEQAGRPGVKVTWLTSWVSNDNVGSA